MLALLATFFKNSPPKHSSGEIEPTLLGTSTRIDKKEHRLKAPTNNLWDFSRLIESNRYSQKSRKTCYSKDGLFSFFIKKTFIEIIHSFLVTLFAAVHDIQFEVELNIRAPCALTE